MWLICISVFASHDNCWCDSELNKYQRPVQWTTLSHPSKSRVHTHVPYSETPAGASDSKSQSTFLFIYSPAHFTHDNPHPLSLWLEISVHLMNAWNHGSIWFFFTFILSLACYLQTGVEHATVQRTHVSGSLRVRHTGEGDVTHGGHFCRSAA